MPTRSIPCEDCASTGANFERNGFRVVGCTPDPAKPGMCNLVVERLETTVAAPRAADAAPSAASATVTVVETVTVTEISATTAPAAAPATTAVGTMAPGPAPVARPQILPAAASPITPTQSRTAQAIVNLFETGEVLGRYGQVTLLPGDPGRLTYGRSQTTLGSGNLHDMLDRYCDNPGARFGSRLQPFMPLFATGDPQLDTDPKLHNLLRACADDPVMRETQDAFFDSAYWQPALRDAAALGLRSPLAIAVVYDSRVHGSWERLRDRTRAAVGEPATVGETAWIQAYVRTRRAWLANHEIEILHATVYRMDAFQRLIDQGLWGLPLPLVVRGAEISALTLAAMPPGCYDGPVPGSRPLGLQQPLLRGLDVRLAQLALSDSGADIHADGVFGQASERCVRQHQAARGLPVTGLLDIAQIGALVA